VSKGKLMFHLKLPTRTTLKKVLEKNPWLVLLKVKCMHDRKMKQPTTVHRLYSDEEQDMRGGTCVEPF
jgi:hypothetical protein